MRLFLLTLAILPLLAAPTLANHADTHAGLHTITVKVNGLVCDFCARAVEKVLYQQDGVESVDVNLDTHAVTVGIADGKDLPDDTLKGLITDAGYTPVEITRE